MDKPDQRSATARDGARPNCRTLPEALDALAASATVGFDFYSGKGALLETLPYATLRADAVALARRLAAIGLAPGSRVAILAETDGDFPRVFFACQYAGLVPAPLPLPTAFGGRQAYLAHARRMIESAEAEAAFAPASLRDWLAEAAAGLDLRFVGTLGDLPAAAVETLPTVTPDDLCYLQFSSGSTRFPMGVAVTQDALMANANAIIRYGLQVVPGDRCVSWLPFYHDMGLIGFMLAPLVAGLPVDYFATRDFARRPMLWLELISRNGGTISYSPSFGYDLCTRRVATSAIETLDLARWRIAGIGGDMIRPKVLSAFAERFQSAGFESKRFVASYGMAETVLALSFGPLDQGVSTDSVDRDTLESRGLIANSRDPNGAREFVSCGKPLPGHHVEIRDGAGAPLPERQVGRIYARGPSMMQGYFGNREATRSVLSSDGWLDTGDLGYRSAGEIVVTGRAKDLIIVNGRNIWPQDLEHTAEAEVEGLRSGDVAAFSIDDGGQEHVVALVECRLGDNEQRRTDLMDAVAKTLRSRHGIEADVVLVKPNALPVTSSGKLSRTRAREMYRTMLQTAAS